MNFGTELKLKKEWVYNSFVTFEKGDTFKVAEYEHNSGMKLHYERIIDLIDFEFNWMNRADRIEEYFEVVETFDDRLAELEKVILDYYLAKGYQVGVGGWAFNVEIESDYKSKQLLVYFRESMHEHYSQVFIAEVETTKEMFDKAIEHFAIKKE